MFCLKNRLAVVRLTIIALFFAIFAGASYLSANISSEAVRTPSIYIASDRIDLGDVEPSQEKTATFIVENHGSLRLVMNEKKCECGEQRRPALLIPPGKAEQIIVPVDTGFERGVVEKMLVFTTNDRKHPEISLTVRAKIVSE